MKTITRLITGEDQQSHFVDEALDLKMMYPDWQVKASQIFNMDQGEVVMWETAAPQELLWVNPPRKQLMVYLGGRIEIEVGSGEKRQFQAGDILIAEDCSGQGHISRILETLTAMVMY